MTQLSAKGREKRRTRYKMLLLELRLLGADAYVMGHFTHTTPNGHNLRELAKTITRVRSQV